MRKEPDDALAMALPPSHTVDLRLPEPVRETPPDEEAVALDADPVGPADQQVATTSIPIPTEPVPVEESFEPLVPLPKPPGGPDVAGKPHREPKPVRPGRRPRPEGLWPEIVYAATLHLVNLGDAPAVRARKQLDARIARTFDDGARFILLLSRKGGVGQTTVATVLGMALADVRADRVVAIDANPDRGTLAERVSKQPRSNVGNILLHAPRLGAFDDLATQLTRDVTGLDVAGSDDDPSRAEPFDVGGYHVVAEVVSRHYGVVLTDAGAGLLNPVTRAALQRADAVVIVSGGGIAEARLASETLSWLEAHDYGALAANAVVALNASTQATDLEKLADIEKHFASRVRAVVVVPYDPELAAGSVVRYAGLRPFTRDSARELAALVVDGIGNQDEA